MAQSLENLEVLVLDCQTTGSNPESGHLLEVGWCLTRASGEIPSWEKLESYLVKLPNGVVVPPHISRMTGITDRKETGAVERGEVWAFLQETAGSVAGGPKAEVYAVAHFARFERAFLVPLQEECAPGVPFPFHFLCTHEIAKRLFPDLPRRGLRALAGYFGRPLPELKRASSHVEATAKLWWTLVRLLREEREIETLDELLVFLKDPPPRRGSRWTYPLAREKRLGLPEKPGVYRFLGGNGDVLYVGKATSLKGRVNSYFRKRRAEDKLLELVSQAHDVKVMETDSALEAALLEAEEIKRCDPPYNRTLRGKGKAVWFFSADLDSSRAVPDRRHRTGPVPDREMFRALNGLFRLLSIPVNEIEDEIGWAKELGLDFARLETGAIREGVRIFLEELFDSEAPERADDLLSLGTALWREQLAAAEAEEEGEEDEEEEREMEEESDKPARERVFDPEAVAGFYRGMVVNSSHMARRGRWFSLLSESVVTWRPARGGRRKKALVVEGGEIRKTVPLKAKESSPIPPGAGKGRPERLRSFDRATYDRLRVLTTELKRLLAEGKEVEVVLEEKRSLGREELRKLLEMV